MSMNIYEPGATSTLASTTLETVYTTSTVFSTIFTEFPQPTGDPNGKGSGFGFSDLNFKGIRRYMASMEVEEYNKMFKNGTPVYFKGNEYNNPGIILPVVFHSGDDRLHQYNWYHTYTTDGGTLIYSEYPPVCKHTGSNTATNSEGMTTCIPLDRKYEKITEGGIMMPLPHDLRWSLYSTMHRKNASDIESILANSAAATPIYNYSGEHHKLVSIFVTIVTIGLLFSLM